MSLHLVPDIATNEPDARDLLKAMPFAAYVTDPDGRITAFNEAASMLWGRETVLGEELWCGSHRLFWPERPRHDAWRMPDGRGAQDRQNHTRVEGPAGAA